MNWKHNDFVTRYECSQQFRNSEVNTAETKPKSIIINFWVYFIQSMSNFVHPKLSIREFWKRNIHLVPSKKMTYVISNSWGRGRITSTCFDKSIEENLNSLIILNINPEQWLMDDKVSCVIFVALAMQNLAKNRGLQKLVWRASRYRLINDT